MNARIRNILVLLLALLWLLPAAAQDEKNIGALVKITAKPGHDEALVTAIIDYHKWIAKHEGAMRYSWYKVVTGPDSGAYYAWSGGHQWSDFDAEYDWQPKAGERFRENVRPHIQGMYRMMARTMNDMSNWPENWDGYTHFHLTDWYVKNGRFGAFRAGLKRIVDALKAGGYAGHWGFHWLESGARAGQVVVVSPTKGWGGLVEPDPSFYDIMTRELGGQDAMDAFMAEWGDSFEQGASYTVEYMPDASDYGDD